MAEATGMCAQRLSPCLALHSPMGCSLPKVSKTVATIADGVSPKQMLSTIIFQMEMLSPTLQG